MNLRAFVAGVFLVGSACALASEGVKVDKDGQCKLRAIQDYIKTTTYKGFSICEGMGNPSQEQDRCVEQHGNGNFDAGVSVVKKRKTYNAWITGIVVQIDYAKEKVVESNLSCSDWLEVINSWSDSPKSLVYQHRQEGKKLIIKNGIVQFAR